MSGKINSFGGLPPNGTINDEVPIVEDRTLNNTSLQSIPEVPTAAENTNEKRESRRRPKGPAFDSNVHFNVGMRPVSSRAPSESGSILSNAGRRFQRARVKITAQLNTLETDKDVHTEELKERVKIVANNFKALKIDDILDRFLYDPNQDEIYGASADNIDEWSEEVEAELLCFQAEMA